MTATVCYPGRIFFEDINFSTMNGNRKSRKKSAQQISAKRKRVRFFGNFAVNNPSQHLRKFMTRNSINLLEIQCTT